MFYEVLPAGLSRERYICRKDDLALAVMGLVEGVKETLQWQIDETGCCGSLPRNLPKSNEKDKGRLRAKVAVIA